MPRMEHALRTIRGILDQTVLRIRDYDVPRLHEKLPSPIVMSLLYLDVTRANVGDIRYYVHCLKSLEGVDVVDALAVLEGVIEVRETLQGLGDVLNLT